MPRSSEHRAAVSTCQVATHVDDLEVTFGGLTARTTREAADLKLLSSSLSDDSVFTSAARYRGEIIAQRSDLVFSAEHVRLMSAVPSPYVRAASGHYEKINLHHVGQRNGLLVEIPSSRNRYPGWLHFIGQPAPRRHDMQPYWPQRLQDAIDADEINYDVLSKVFNR